MTQSEDRLYELLPVVHRQRDARQGYPLKALLRVIAEQVNLVEADIEQLYENWFIETCQDWVVPYIGDLLRHGLIHEAGSPADPATPQGRLLNKILIPRREVARTIRNRRRKGTLAILELLARDVAGWPARAVEFYKLLGWAQSLNHLRLDRGRTADLRDGDALDLLGGPFDPLAHTVDVRRINSQRTRGRFNIPSLGLFVWRLKDYSVTRSPAFCEDAKSHCFTFSALGNDAPLYTNPSPEPDPSSIASPLNLPVPIRRRPLERDLGAYYGPERSFAIWAAGWADRSPVQAIPQDKIIVADLTDWQYRCPSGNVAVDPVLGRMAFPTGKKQRPNGGVWVSYHYGFSTEIGGGEYSRTLSQPDDFTLYQVGQGRRFEMINEALMLWKEEKPANAVIEITDSGVYSEQINIELEGGQSLQLRAANRARPIIRLLNWQTARPDALWVTGPAEEEDREEEVEEHFIKGRGGRFVLDGLLVAGRGVQFEGRLDELSIRHSTLVPGWSIHPDCRPCCPTEASLELNQTQARVAIEHSIIGTIHVSQDEVGTDPIPIRISDSILDATSLDCEAVGSQSWPLAHAVLTIERSTVLGEIQAHAIELAEDSIFMGLIQVARRQLGCMRFCYVTPGSRTPRRYNCQPDLVEKAARAAAPEEDRFPPSPALAAELQREQQRVRPRFESAHYGRPEYCRLAQACADEIKRGAADESEMGVLHDLYEPQRAANLRVRLDEFTPAGTNAGVIFAD